MALIKTPIGYIERIKFQKVEDLFYIKCQDLGGAERYFKASPSRGVKIPIHLKMATVAGIIGGIVLCLGVCSAIVPVKVVKTRPALADNSCPPGFAYSIDKGLCTTEVPRVKGPLGAVDKAAPVSSTLSDFRAYFLAIGMISLMAGGAFFFEKKALIGAGLMVFALVITFCIDAMVGVDITATFGNLGLDVFSGLLAILLAVLSWAIGYGQRKEENKFRQVKAGNYVLDFCSMKEIQVNSLPAGFLKD